MRNTAKISGKKLTKSTNKVTVYTVRGTKTGRIRDGSTSRGRPSARRPSILDLAKKKEAQKLVEHLRVIETEENYEEAKEDLRNLMLNTEDTPDNPYAGLMDYLSYSIEQYENKHYPIPASTGAEVLQFLMDEHGLTQKDLSEIGSQGVVSEILNGKRELNKRHIELLSKRFNVSPAVFFGDKEN